MAKLTPLPVLLVFSQAFHLLHSLIQAQPSYIYKICTNTSNYKEGSQFQENLNSLLSQPIHNDIVKSSTGIFYNTTRGNFPDEVYGIFLCRADVPAITCQNCIDAARVAIVNECPFTIEAIIWYDECLIRYSNGYLFSRKDEVPLVSTSNVTDTKRFDEIHDKFNIMFNGIIFNASYDSSYRMYAKAQVNITGSIRLYGMVQCTPDLSPVDCFFCLSNCWGHPFSESGGRVLTPICNIRYELYSANMTVHPRLQRNGMDHGAERRKTTIITIGASVSAFLVVAFLGFCIWYRRRRKRTEEEKQANLQKVQLPDLAGERLTDDYSGETFSEENQANSQDFPLLRFDLIREATQQFSVENKLGEGGFGPVYMGTLADGKKIAVKRLSRSSGQGLKEFKAEVTLIARLQHRNLVKLLGCCLEGKELLLVYDYMPNKSLDVFLVDPTKGAQLDWTIRHRIINGIARGMLYLHEDSRLRIIHRDLKSSNVLLDHEMNPKISDFGMARIVGSNQIEANTNRVVGTYGYMAPEYAMKGIFSVKSDVFSFGVLLLEIISGKKNSRFHLSGHGHNLLTFAWKLWSDDHGLELLDLLLKESYVETEVLKCIHIGLLCVQEDPANRPTMSSVVFMLGSDAMTLPQPTEPAFFLGRVFPSAQPEPKDIGSSVNEVTLSNVSPR